MRKLFALALLVLCFRSHAQIKAGGSYKDYFQEGSYLLLEDNFIMASENFEAAYQIDSSNANINYFMGLCYLHSATNKAKAETFLSKAIDDVSRTYKTDNHQEKSAPPLAHYYYGKALHINYKFDEAIAQFDAFQKYVSAKDKEWKKMLDREKEIASFAKEWVKVPMNIQISNLGDSINSLYPDYSPVLSADERMMIFTTRRPSTTGGMKDFNGLWNEDVVVSYKDEMGNWSSPQPISANINSSGMEASINLTPDGQTLIIYRDGGDGMGGNIYYSNFDGKDWSSLKEFGSDVNTKHWESHACLSHDGNVLFFVSDRPGGHGGRDIYRCVKLPNGKWSKALNMGPSINTEYDEDGAFIHPDGRTFFFASKGHKTMGGFDIMFATLAEDNNTFTDVANIGYPINTTDDDIFYVASPDGKRGYFSSAKEGGQGEKDIYLISIPQATEKPLALFKGTIIPADGEKLPDDLTIIVHDKQTGEVVGVYRPKVVNGTFSTILPPGKEYNFSYQSQGEEFYNEDVFVSSDLSYNEIKREVSLEPVKFLGKIRAKQKSILLTALIFDNAKSKKAVPGAKITLTEEGGASQTFEANDKGRFENIELKPDKKYTVTAESNGKKSPAGEISTMGVKSGKVMNQVVYMEGKPEKTTSKELLLDVIVKNKKTKKAISNASVTLTDADGNKTDATTDEKGMIKGMELSPDTKYTLSANSEGAVSETASFATAGVKGAKKITKTLLITVDAVASNNNNNNNNNSNNSGNNGSANTSPSKYEFYFTYNKNQNDESEEWTNFIDNIVEKSKKRVVTISINASASRVPTRAYKNNKELAATRASKLAEKIKAAVEAKGGEVKKLRFAKVSSVGGPRYRGDHDIKRKTYEKYQYVKARAK